MALNIETFRNADLSQGWRPGNNPGGETLFKALGHPITADKAKVLIEEIRSKGPVVIFDPLQAAGNFSSFFDISAWDIAGYFVQRVEDLGTSLHGQSAQLVNEIGAVTAPTLFVMDFDVAQKHGPLLHIFPSTAHLTSFDDMRLPDTMLTNKKNYLDPMNFATNFGLMRDVSGPNGEDLHTRITTANYWGNHGAKDPELYCRLFDQDGEMLVEWHEKLPNPGVLLTIDSRVIRQKFGLGDFFGSLFMHATRIAGHDIVKYALDTYGDQGRALSCNHDANAWPADYYAGLPAPHSDEDVTLFIQNSHPSPIPAGALGLNLMGSDDVHFLDESIAPFATRTLNTKALLPDANWPQQIEVVAGRHFVRPRYEVVKSSRDKQERRRRIAHANVERTDLKPDPHLPELHATMGKGYIMPLPVPPLTEFSSAVVPTPMARQQNELPVRADLFDATGEMIDSNYLGRLRRSDSQPLLIDGWLKEKSLSLSSGFGHVEFLYDFREGGEADGWLHALGRYEQRTSGHVAETIFGAHIYNTPIIYKDEPQSYINRPPGLTTRLFLRLGHEHVDGRETDTICHLVYPASLPWHALSATELQLHDSTANIVATRSVQIPCGGSLFWRYHDLFDADLRSAAGSQAYIVIRDPTCRLFGFHGLLNGDESFCLDHMFGF